MNSKISILFAFAFFWASIADNLNAQPPTEADTSDTEEEIPIYDIFPLSVGQNPGLASYSEWIYQVGNPDPKVIIFTGDLARDMNAQVELVSTVWDDLIWDWLLSRMPSSYVPFELIYRQIILPSNAYSIDKKHPRKGLFNELIFYMRWLEQGDKSVLYEHTYLGLKARAPIKQFSGFNKNIHRAEFKFCTKLNKEYKRDILLTDCFDNPVYATYPNDITINSNRWLFMVEYDTLHLSPSSKIGTAALESKSNPYPNPSYPSHYMGYRLLTRFSCGASCYDRSKFVSYLNWYTQSASQGYARKTHLGKAYYLDQAAEILVIGEQNPETGEWQGDFEAYFLNINTPKYPPTPIRFLKGQHDKNKRVGTWTFFSSDFVADSLKKVDYMDSNGNFLRSEKVKQPMFSDEELLQHEKTVAPFLAKERK